MVNYCNPLSGRGHYAVINGYSKEKKLVYLADPANGNDYTLRFREFKKLWHNEKNTIKKWCVIIGRETITILNKP
jgi:hypothetical protein